MISFDKVSKSFAKQDILQDCSFQVNAGERVGLIGANGSGKSTIFRLLMGFEHPDQGQIIQPKNLRLGYLPQDVLQFRGKTVLDQVMDVAEEVQGIETELSLMTSLLEKPLPESELAKTAARQSRLLEEYERLGGYNLEARARKLLAGLGFSNADMERQVEEMSGGWAMRVALARILLAEPDIMLLDEPTNHLDLDSLVWLEQYLVQTPASLMLVSHDRVFLDHVVHRLLEVENGQITSYSGDFQHYLEEKEKQIQSQWSAYNHQQEQIRQIKRFIDRNRARKDRARQVQSRIKMLEKMDRLQPPRSPDRFSFSFPPPSRAPQVVLQLHNVSKSYGEDQVFSDVNVTLQRDDRVALLGPNGTGKTTLVKLMAGALDPDRGRRSIGSGVHIAYFAQQQLELLNPQQTVLESLSSMAGDMGQGQLRNLLGSFLFRNEEVNKKVSVLSGGERSRLLLCQILAQQANFLLLDEPNNHLDIQGRRVLEQALQAYKGAICLVSHDRHLINGVANKVLLITDRRAEIFPGNYHDFQAIWKQRLPGPEPDVEAPLDRNGTAVVSKKNKEQKRFEAQWRNELSRMKAPLAQHMENLEQTIERITSRLEELNHLLSQPHTYENGSDIGEVNREYAELKNSLEEHTRQWEEAAMELAALEESFRREKRK
jgi:ATP-binding cassette subfamily F protein 3